MPALTPQAQFLADTQTKMKQYLYRGLEQSFDPTIEFIQLISKVGPINWSDPTNNVRVQRVFTNLAASIGAYTMLSGDFRTYLLLSFVDILYAEFSNELFSEYVGSSYNVDPATVVGTLDTTPDLAPPQTSSFPGLTNTSSQISPMKRSLVPSVIYNLDAGFGGFPKNPPQQQSNTGLYGGGLYTTGSGIPGVPLMDQWDKGNGDSEGLPSTAPPTDDGSGVI